MKHAFVPLVLAAAAIAAASFANGPAGVGQDPTIELPAALSDASKACIKCHRKDQPAIYQQWGSSKHYRGNVRLLAVSRLRDEGPGRRLAGSGDLAEHRHRTHQPRRLGGLVLGLPRAPRVLGRAGAPPRHLRQVPPGPGPPAEGDLRGVQARHRLLRQPGRDEPGLGEVDRRRGLLPRPHLRHLPHVGHQGPAGHARHRHAHQLEQPPGGLDPPRGLRRQDGPAGQGRPPGRRAGPT